MVNCEDLSPREREVYNRVKTEADAEIKVGWVGVGWAGWVGGVDEWRRGGRGTYAV